MMYMCAFVPYVSQYTLQSKATLDLHETLHESQQARPPGPPPSGTPGKNLEFAQFSNLCSKNGHFCILRQKEASNQKMLLVKVVEHPRKYGDG